MQAVKSLWNEVGLYAQMREEEEQEREAAERIEWDDDGERASRNNAKWAEGRIMVADFPPAPANITGLTIAAKPWFVVATKGDKDGTQENFQKLKRYMNEVTAGSKPHPSGFEGAWTKDCAAIPVSAINGHAVDRILHWTVGLLDE